MLDGVLFFPVTPFTAAGEVDTERLAQHIATGVDAGPGGVFAACGTGEFHALDTDEVRTVVRTTVDVVGGRVPVYAGAGGSLAQAKSFARAAAEAGADGLLLLPPYLVEMPQAGLVAYTRAVAAVTDLPLIVYNRNNARYTEASAVEVAQIPNVVGFKDGTGDFDRVGRIVRAVYDALAPSGKPFQFFNGLPTAEVSQQAFRAIGVTLYSSATFAFAPDLALAFYQALETGNEQLSEALSRAFFHPLVRLRDKVPGYPVALIKAGVALEGLDAGPVRPPLIDAAPEDVEELRTIIAAGRAVLAEALAAPSVR
ncbi:MULTISPECIES: 5-dehydro-4-deoxyglucarate dehydratase [Mycolicibacterium]|uniref:Probable 5-dehydro-4-deoxyglucarate dehydratase n=2 Tax=Mycolicibacterium TaxID=1866885 RepID=A0A9X2YG36_9MYCO|nr:MULTISPECIES: 5-dehydro-4-deoxyglucarate dehydratase [Mycolicibacterium]MCV7173993.1 5-dehydro-4-deoxyglucarate dehydratase [[Mycobacterium] manitobense]MDO3635893.1 5-dehydro-4-deoxyglucarate dehydratase [Mycolicibacterium arseniciresistens]